MSRTFRWPASSALILLISAASPVLSGPQQSSKNAAQPAPTTAQAVNEEYTRKIKEYTTEKYFLTELVDHLPASDRVPSPTRFWLRGGNTRQADLHTGHKRYMRELAKASPRVESMGSVDPTKGARSWR